MAFNAAGNAQSTPVTLSVYPPWYDYCPHCFIQLPLPNGCTADGWHLFYTASCARRKCRPKQYIEPADVCTSPQTQFVCKQFNSRPVQVSIHSTSSKH